MAVVHDTCSSHCDLIHSQPSSTKNSEFIYQDTLYAIKEMSFIDLIAFHIHFFEISVFTVTLITTVMLVCVFYLSGVCTPTTIMFLFFYSFHYLNAHVKLGHITKFLSTCASFGIKIIIEGIGGKRML